MRYLGFKPKRKRLFVPLSTKISLPSGLVYLPVPRALYAINTSAETDLDPPAPEHEIVKVFLPTVSKFIDSELETDLLPVQSSLAVHDVAFVDDQVTSSGS